MDLSREGLRGRIGRMEQLAAIKRYAIEDGKGRGMRAFEVVNGSGFDFTVYPDRGLDLGPARYNGLPLTWTSRNGPVSPAFYDMSGVEWLRTWGGGLLTTCGWLNVGGPCRTPEGDQGLHGRMDHTPAEEVNTRAFWKTADEYVMEISGRMVLSRVFGENLVTSRTIMTRLGWPGVEVVDRTENMGDATMPLMQLYHMNFGWPLISEKTRLVAPVHSVTPRDDEAAKGVPDWDTFLPPTAGFAEQVIYHDLPADVKGWCAIRISNPSFGPDVSLAFRKAELPYLVQWRMPGFGDYVMGLEPANCYAEDYNSMAAKGMLRYIEPGQVVKTCIRLSVGC